MQIHINERPFELQEESSLAEVLEQLDIASKGVAVAVNSVVVPSAQWQGCTLKENDAVMIIQPFQGG